ncbi:MAG TPA: alpha/beta fold hydrolase [Pseudonocardiaceae bacterium]
MIERYGPEPDQYRERYLPAQPKHPGTVLIIHGGFWLPDYDASLGRPLAQDLAERGFTAVNLEYRRSGWQEMSADVLAGVASLTGDVVAVGHSAGGQLAVYAAQHGRLAGVVAQAGVLDLATAAQDRIGGRAVSKLLGGTPEEVPERYREADPIGLPPRVPVVCVHSRTDQLVPFAQSEAYAARTGARLIEVPGDHFAHLDTSSPAWAAVLDVLPELLSRPN